MTLWFVFALMTAAAVFAVLWPLSRRGVSMREGSDVAVYRDQLDEIARDRAAGLIGEAEAQAAKVEVSRRLIAAADIAETGSEADGKTDTDKAPEIRDRSSLWRRRVTAAAALLLVPVGTTALYLKLGSPQLPGEPLAARLQAVNDNSPIAKMVAQVEAHLAKNPNDARGYEVLAPVYLRLGRAQDAVRARRKVIELSGASATRQANLGEALIAAANGVVTDEAKRAFEQALKLDPNELKATFFTGLAAQQDGNIEKAAEIWRGMLAKAPADAPWVRTVRRALANIGKPVAPVGGAVTSGAPGPNAADVAAASKMSAGDRNAMIKGMVARLADRLKQNGNDVAGWQRLLRAYMVLGERDKAVAAAANARKALAGEPDKLQQIDAMIKSLGLES